MRATSFDGRIEIEFDEKTKVLFIQGSEWHSGERILIVSQEEDEMQNKLPKLRDILKKTPNNTRAQTEYTKYMSINATSCVQLVGKYRAMNGKVMPIHQWGLKPVPNRKGFFFILSHRGEENFLWPMDMTRFAGLVITTIDLGCCNYLHLSRKWDPKTQTWGENCLALGPTQAQYLNERGII
jgi:hypothetical protein